MQTQKSFDLLLALPSRNITALIIVEKYEETVSCASYQNNNMHKTR